MVEKPLSYLIDSLLPEYIKEDYPIYVSFIKRYLEMTEEETGPFKVLNEITKYIDVSIAPEESLPDFIYQYLNSFPEEFLEEVNVREFITNSKNYYSTKGNEAAIRFVFNLIGGTIDFYYPSKEIFEINSSTLSGSHKLHDNYYYAYYVYEIISDLNSDEYEDIIREMSHPIGEKLVFKQIIFIDVDGQIFDANINYSNYDIYSEISVDFSDLEFENNFKLNIENILDFKLNNLSDIIEDYFFAAEGKNIVDYKDLSVHDIMFEEAEPTDTKYTIKNSDDDIDFLDTASVYTIESTTTDLSVFEDGETITIANSTSNDGDFTISGAPTSTKITVTESLTQNLSPPTATTISNE